MAYSNYVRNPTWADGPGGGTSIDAADLNANDVGVFNAFYQPNVHVFHNAAQSIANATFTALAFNSERYDQAGNAADTQHDTVTNNTRLTCRYAGVYEIGGCCEWASSPTNASIHIRYNGTGTGLGTALARQQTVADYRIMHVSVRAALNVNDWVELVVQQNSGGALNVNSTGNYSPEFWMGRVG